MFHYERNVFYCPSFSSLFLIVQHTSLCTWQSSVSVCSVLRVHKFPDHIRIKCFMLWSRRMHWHMVCTWAPTFLKNLLPSASSATWVLLNVHHHENIKSKCFEFCHLISVSQHIVNNSSALPQLCPLIYKSSSGSYSYCHTEMSFLHTCHCTEAV